MITPPVGPELSTVTGIAGVLAVEFVALSVPTATTL